MIGIFNKAYFKKLTSTSPSLNFTLLTTKIIVHPAKAKQKQSRGKPAKFAMWANKSKLVGVEELKLHDSTSTFYYQ